VNERKQSGHLTLDIQKATEVRETKKLQTSYMLQAWKL